MCRKGPGKKVLQVKKKIEDLYSKWRGFRQFMGSSRNEEQSADKGSFQLQFRNYGEYKLIQKQVTPVGKLLSI